MATKNFFMDIYAKEISKMQSVSKSSATTKKRNFDATQFNTYGLPLGKLYCKFCMSPVSFFLRKIYHIYFNHKNSRSSKWILIIHSCIILRCSVLQCIFMERGRYWHQQLHWYCMICYNNAHKAGTEQHGRVRFWAGKRVPQSFTLVFFIFAT
jgi:hypothetical protein